MPGAYAHLTLAGLLAASKPLNKAEGFPKAAKAALLDNARFCDLGAVSPDYPYLKLVGSSLDWADQMHHIHTGKMILAGVDAVRDLADPDRAKCFAWLLGYISHVVGDVTIHPVVQLKVGPYERNKQAHRVCEMHQDSHIFRRLGLGPIGVSEYLDSGLGMCSASNRKDKLDPAVVAVWRKMLKSCYPERYRKRVPDINSWHEAFVRTVDAAEESGRLIPIARHVGVSLGLMYPNPGEIDPQYIRGLATPEGAMDYDAVFDRARRNVLEAWALAGAAVYDDDVRYLSFFEDWNLDTGLNNRGGHAFWGNGS